MSPLKKPLLTAKAAKYAKKIQRRFCYRTNPSQKTLKVFLANRDFAKAKETFRVFVYGREKTI